MRGNAIDFSIPGVALEEVRAAGLRAQRGGVGFYPSSNFVHMDTGSVRHWPRMPEEQLARVIAKGQLNSRLASDSSSGRGIAVAQATRKPAFLARLFGGGEEEPAETAAATKPTTVAAQKPAAKLADKPAEKPAAPPVPAARPAKTETVQLAAATSKPAAKPETFQVASATTKTIAVVLRPEDDEVVASTSRPTQPPKTFEVASAASRAAPAPKTLETAPSQLPPPASFQVASAATRPAQAASLVARTDTANEIISERGFWQGLPSAEPIEAAHAGVARPTSAAPRLAVASADPKATASLAPWPLARSNEPAAPPNALAYAAQPSSVPQSRPVPPMGSGNTRPAAAQPQTTVVVKRSDDRLSVAPPQPSRVVQVVRAGDRFNDPWMRAMIVSPSAQDFLRTTLYGVQDFRHLGPYLRKPDSSVMMTFSANPHLGMDADRFAGSAVVFVSTVTFSARTASLR